MFDKEKMFQAHKKSALVRNEEKKLSVLGNFDNSKSAWIRTSVLTVESKKSSIGRFINFSKNNSIYDNRQSNDYTNDVSSGFCESDTKSHLNLDKIKSLSQIKSEEISKLGRKGSILQKILTSTLDTNMKIKEVEKQRKNFDFSKYCKKVKVANSFHTNYDEKMIGRRNKSNDKVVLGIYSKENLAMKVFDPTTRFRVSHNDGKPLKKKRNKSLNDNIVKQ